MIKVPPQKILVVKLGSIGDVVNTLPFVNVLKDSWPETELAWLIEPKSYPLIEGHPSVDRFIVFQRGKGWPGAREVLRKIHAFQPELVIDLQRVLRSSFFTFFSKCNQRLGFDRRRSKELSWLFTNIRIAPADPNWHLVWQYLEFARYLGLEWSEVEFRLLITKRDREEAKQLLNSGAAGGGFIVLNVGATKPANRWPEKHWAHLACLLLKKTPYYVVLTGGLQDKEEGQTIVKHAQAGEQLIDLTGRTTLKELAGLFTLARAVVSSDTGPMHIASALGTRTIGLFGPADPRRTGPFNHLDSVVCARVDCAPCRKRRCRSRKCMEDISPERVVDKIFSVKKS